MFDRIHGANFWTILAFLVFMWCGMSDNGIKCSTTVVELLCGIYIEDYVLEYSTTVPLENQRTVTR